jgi:hypothetical protein
MAVYKLSAAGGITTPRTNYSSFLAGNPAVIFTDYHSIATVTVGSGGTSTINFNSISSDYTHLQLRSIARDGGANDDTSSLKITFNSDTSSAYTRHGVFGNGSTVVSFANLTTGHLFNGQIAQGGTSAGTFAGSVLDILDYRNTNKNTTVRGLGGADCIGNGSVLLGSSLWANTAAITSISITSSTATNFAEYSHFALYGIKG